MEGVGLAHLYPALAWSSIAPGHHGYPRAPDLILRKALRGRLGHQITGATARPVSPFPQSNSQISAGTFRQRPGGRSSAGSISDRRAGTPPAVEGRLASISAMARVFRDRDDEKSVALVRQIAERLVEV